MWILLQVTWAVNSCILIKLLFTTIQVLCCIHTYRNKRWDNKTALRFYLSLIFNMGVRSAAMLDASPTERQRWLRLLDRLVISILYTRYSQALCLCRRTSKHTWKAYCVTHPYQSSYFIQQNSAKKQNKTTKPNTTKQNEINSRRQKHCCWTMSDNFQPEVILPYPPVQEGCPHWRAG